MHACMHPSIHPPSRPFIHPTPPPPAWLLWSGPGSEEGQVKGQVEALHSLSLEVRRGGWLPRLGKGEEFTFLRTEGGS